MAKRLRDPSARLGNRAADQLRGLENQSRPGEGAPRVPESMARWAEDNTRDGIVTRRVLRRNLTANAGAADVRRNLRDNLRRNIEGRG